MASASYKLYVRYAPKAGAPPRRTGCEPRLSSSTSPASARKPDVVGGNGGSAIRGMIYASPIAIMLWVPILWAVSRFF
jgi:hypothetical protein